MRMIVPQLMHKIEWSNPDRPDILQTNLMFTVSEPGDYMLVEIEGNQYLARYVPGEWGPEQLHETVGIPKSMLEELLASR